MGKARTPLALLLILSVLVATTPVFASSRGGQSAETAPSVTQTSFPDSAVLTDHELSSIQGSGFLTTIGATIGGAITGAAGYAGSYTYNRFVAKSRPRWNWHSMGAAASGGAAAGFTGSIFFGWWAP